MKKSLIYIFVITSIIFISFAIANADMNNNTENILIENKVIKKIISEHNFIGVNSFDDCELNRNFLLNPVQMNLFGNLLKDLNIDFIRYPAGLNVSAAFWDVPTKDIQEALRKLPKSEQCFMSSKSKIPNDRWDFLSFIKFCKKNGIKADIQVNTHNWFDKDNREMILLKEYERTPDGKRIPNTGRVNWKLVNKAADYATLQLKWAKDNGYLNNVEYWELGNEEFAVNHFLNPGYTADEYAKVATIFIKKMTAVDPSIKFILSGIVESDDYPYGNIFLKNYLNNWFITLLKNPELKNYKNNIFAVSIHIEGRLDENIGKFNFSDFLQENLKNPKLDVTKRINFQRKLLDNEGYYNTKIFMNEFNSNNFLNKYMHTWISALGLSKMILSCVNNPTCYHADYHQLMHYFKNVSLGFGLVHYARDFSDMPFIKYPSAYVVGLLNENIKGDILKTTFNNKEIYALTASDNDYIKVVILNTEKTREISLKLQNFRNLKYVANKSLGIDVPLDFTVMDEGDSMTSPSEVRLLNVLDNAIQVKNNNGDFKINLPANTLSVFIFKKSF